MSSRFVNPEKGLSAFNCPHCGAYAQQGWGVLHSMIDFQNLSFGESGPKNDPNSIGNLGFFVSYCSHCTNIALWHDNSMIYPFSGLIELPNDDMPENVKKDYLEARSIYAQSPRGALALLRLALQKLMIYFGEKGENLNDDIGNLVQQGKLNPRVQKLMDSIRVFGSEAVHPLEIDLSEDNEITPKMFTFLNLIVDDMITQEKVVDSIYEDMPRRKKEGIANRDEQKGNP
ncbi:DUF4145 domain-containing protein [Methanoculleus sp. MH98A]|uniref:DUF4145 domain-containing protein n=1 Tax=Methanoculleus sp. MH98A TaxID=1495314 RepID=UPI0004A08835|nr:DUF4145 domain-containing protein [Methanoculleus sp. MH98A]KDE54292.1 hypothetical protein EI28_13595 [Methanoculleus sp. MH98A]